MQYSQGGRHWANSSWPTFRTSLRRGWGMVKMGGLWQERAGSRSGVKPFGGGHRGSAPGAGCPGPGASAPPPDPTHLCEEVIPQQAVQAGPLRGVGRQQAGDEAARVGGQVGRLGVAAGSDVLVHLRQGSRREGRGPGQRCVPAPGAGVGVGVEGGAGAWVPRLGVPLPTPPCSGQASRPLSRTCPTPAPTWPVPSARLTPTSVCTPACAGSAPGTSRPRTYPHLPACTGTRPSTPPCRLEPVFPPTCPMHTRALARLPPAPRPPTPVHTCARLAHACLSPSALPPTHSHLSSPAPALFPRPGAPRDPLT